MKKDSETYGAYKIWMQRRPKMVKHLEKNGLLEEALNLAVEQAREEFSVLVSRQDMDPHLAREIVDSKWINLPTEKEKKRLSPDQMPFSQP